MKEIIVALIAVVMLCGCGQLDRSIASVTGNAESCIDGVTYIQFTSGACVKVDINGKPVGCK